MFICKAAISCHRAPQIRADIAKDAGTGVFSNAQQLHKLLVHRNELV